MMKKACCCVLIFCCILTLLAGCGGSGSSGEKSVLIEADTTSSGEFYNGINGVGNIANGGLVAADKDFVYYYDESEYSIYRMQANGTDIVRFNEEPMYDGVRYIQVVDEWLYYFAGEDIYRMRTDGSDNTQLSQSYFGHEINRVNVVDEYVYFITAHRNGNIWRMKTDGTGLEIVFETDERWLATGATQLYNTSTYYLTIDGEWAYFFNYMGGEGGIWRMNIDGSSCELVHNASGQFLNAFDEWLYYIDESYMGPIIRVRADGTGRELLVDGNCRNINVADGWVYYINADDGQSLYRVRVDGTENHLVVDDGCSDINIANGWIYYSGTEQALFRVRLDGSERELINSADAILGETPLVLSPTRNESPLDYFVPGSTWTTPPAKAPGAPDSQQETTDSDPSSSAPDTSTEPMDYPPDVIAWDSPMEATIDADGGLNMRIGPDSTFDKVVLIPDRATIIVLGESKTSIVWWYVEHDGVMGYVHSDYLEYDISRFL